MAFRYGFVFVRVELGYENKYNTVSFEVRRNIATIQTVP